MQTINVELTLPDDIFARAQEFGWLSPDYLRELIKEKAVSQSDLPEGYDPRLARFFSPDIYGKFQIIGDVVSPIMDEEIVSQDEELPEGYDVSLRRFVNPKAFGVQILGDIVSPIFDTQNMEYTQ